MFFSAIVCDQGSNFVASFNQPIFSSKSYSNGQNQLSEVAGNSENPDQSGNGQNQLSEVAGQVEHISDDDCHFLSKSISQMSFNEDNSESNDGFESNGEAQAEIIRKTKTVTFADADEIISLQEKSTSVITKNFTPLDLAEESPINIDQYIIEERELDNFTYKDLKRFRCSCHILNNILNYVCLKHPFNELVKSLSKFAQQNKCSIEMKKIFDEAKFRPKTENYLLRRDFSSTLAVSFCFH